MQGLAPASSEASCVSSAMSRRVGQGTGGGGLRGVYGGGGKGGGLGGGGWKGRFGDPHTRQCTHKAVHTQGKAVCGHR